MATAFATPKDLLGAKGFPLTCQPQHQRSICNTTFTTHSNRRQERLLRPSAHYRPIGQQNPFTNSHKNRYQETTPTHPISSINNTYIALFPQEAQMLTKSSKSANRLWRNHNPNLAQSLRNAPERSARYAKLLQGFQTGVYSMSHSYLLSRQG